MKKETQMENRHSSANANNNQPAGSCLRSGQGGTAGFPAELTGRGKADHGGTTSFEIDLEKELHLQDPGNVSTGQEESGRLRQEATSAAGRIYSSVPFTQKNRKG